MAGVAVALSVFGLFGGSKILCDKGTLGTQTFHDRVILHIGEYSTIHLPYSSKLSFQEYKDEAVFVTGQYDNCSQALKAENIELAN